MSRHAVLTFEVTNQINRLPVLKAGKLNIFPVQKNHPPPVANAAVVIVQSVDRCVELIVAAHCQHQELVRLQIDLRQRMNREMRAAVFGFEFPSTDWIRQIEPAGLSHAGVVVFKARHHVLDVISNEIII